MQSTRLLPLAGAALVLAACDEPTAPTDPVDATGRWEAFVDDSVLDLQLIEFEDFTIEGVGHIRPWIVEPFGSWAGPVPVQPFFPAPIVTAPSVALRAEGNVLWPSVSLSLRSIGFEDIAFSGQWIGEHSIRGFLFGSGFEGEMIVLRRRDVRVHTTAIRRLLH